MEAGGQAREKPANRIAAEDQVIIDTGSSRWSPADEFAQAVVEAIEASNPEMAHEVDAVTYLNSRAVTRARSSSVGNVRPRCDATANHEVSGMIQSRVTPVSSFPHASGGNPARRNPRIPARSMRE